MSNEKISKETWARTIALAVTLANYALVQCGKNPLPYSDTEIFNFISGAAAIVMTVVSWWKNNSFTKAAIKGDNIMKEIKEGGNNE